MRKLFKAALLLAACIFSQPGHAAGITVSLCGASATGVAFGSYNPLSPVDTDSNGTITFGCIAAGVGTFTYTISIGASNGTVAGRQLKSGANLISYNLYQDMNRTQIWGDGTSGTSVFPANVAVAVVGLFSNTYTVFGRIPALQNKPSGSYADTVTVTVTF
ncbi:spore coat U domain-containing protein [Undibacterium sp.]|uniref:Csu type fimbrial protein n=1 Tax=Undibacterium sp. TaxID=1914977 RepID=UPI00374D4242